METYTVTFSLTDTGENIQVNLKFDPPLAQTEADFNTLTERGRRLQNTATHIGKYVLEAMTDV